MTTQNAWQERNDPIIKSFRANNGRLAGQGRGSSLLLLTTTGARSGQPRVAPLAFTRSGEHYVVIASKGGSPSHPDWYHNLVRQPTVTVEVGGETFRARARVAEGDEHNTLFEAQARQMPNFAEYQQKTSRKIPVIVLERLSAPEE
jgi:deazaflavin-dependent oxidoreductase (nitroreductase family)